MSAFDKYFETELTKNKAVLDAIFYGDDILDPYPLDWQATPIKVWSQILEENESQIQEKIEELGLSEECDTEEKRKANVPACADVNGIIVTDSLGEDVSYKYMDYYIGNSTQMS